MEDQINKFLSQIIDEKGLPSDIPEVRDQILEDLKVSLLDQIDRAIVYELPEDKAIQFASKLEDPNFGEEETQQFIAGSGIDVNQVIMRTMLQFRELYLGLPSVNGSANTAQD